MNGGHHRQPQAPEQEQAVAQTLIIVDDIELCVRQQFLDLAICAKAEGKGFGECSRTYRHDLIEIDGVVEARENRPYRVLGLVEIKAVEAVKLYAIGYLRVRRSRHDVNFMTQITESPGQIVYVDTLPTAVRIAAIG